MTDSTPKRFLAIDTSTTRGAVALVAADKHEVSILAQREFLTKRSHNSALFSPLDELLTLLDGQPIEAILVGTGPGSYTGIRIGIAAANGLAVARKTRVVGIPSVIGICPENDSYLAVGDARRGKGFHWKIVNGIPQGEAQVTPNNELLSIIAESPHPIVTLENLPAEFTTEPQKINLQSLVSRYLRAPHSFEAAGGVEPIYLAAPFITTPKQP